MPEQPTYDDIARFARTLTDRRGGTYGVCLRGKAGWGENVAYLSTVVNTFGGRWFDLNWRPTIDSPEWLAAVGFYVDLLQRYGPPGASSNGFNENLALFAGGRCAMWIDATVAASMLVDPTVSLVAEHVGFAPAPVARTPKGSRWIWSWALAIPRSSDSPEAAMRFIAWATSRDYVELVGETDGWSGVPPGTRYSTYEDPRYLDAAPFAPLVLESILSADPVDNTLLPSPYDGIQYVGIPEFQGIGARVGQTIAGVLSGTTPREKALREMQDFTYRTMRRAGYLSAD
jgi:sorbitol/mannitol transport system substrate-binding protein